MRTMNILGQIYWFFLDIFFPKRCLGCNKPETFLCGECAKKIELTLTPTCPNCGKISEFNKYCTSCKRELKPRLKGLLIASSFEIGPTKEVIHHLKYAGFVELADVLGELICQKIQASNLKINNFVIVPVPLHKKKLSERGFNQSELIARYVAKRLDIPGGDALVRTKYTETQTKLSKEERIKNVSNAFACEDVEFIKNKNIFLIDDVTTTGSTLNACANVLSIAGAKEVWGVVAAHRR